MNGNFDLEQKKIIWQAAKIIRLGISDDVARRWEDNMLDAKIFHDDIRAAVVAEDLRQIIWCGFSWCSSFEGESYWQAVYMKCFSHSQTDASNLLHNFAKWGRDRKIDTGGTVAGQMEKLDEEFNELWSAFWEFDHESREWNSDVCKDTEVKDAIGDMIVVLSQICLIKGWTVEECMQKAWDDIKDRKGEMVNGVFVKEVSK